MSQFSESKVSAEPKQNCDFHKLQTNNVGPQENGPYAFKMASHMILFGDSSFYICSPFQAIQSFNKLLIFVIKFIKN